MDPFPVLVRDAFMVIVSHATSNIYQVARLRSVCKRFRRWLTPLPAWIPARWIRDRLPLPDPDLFCASLHQSGAVLAGGFVLQCIMGETWKTEPQHGPPRLDYPPGSEMLKMEDAFRLLNPPPVDLDIFHLHLTGGRLPMAAYLRQINSDLVPIEHDDAYNHNPRFQVQSYRYGERQKLDFIEFFPATDIKEAILHNFDMCQCMISFDGVRISCPYWNLILNKTMAISPYWHYGKQTTRDFSADMWIKKDIQVCDDIRCRLYARLHKYHHRGFTIDEDDATTMNCIAYFRRCGYFPAPHTFTPICSDQ